MNSLRRTMLSLLVLLPLCFAACTPASDSGMTGRAVGVGDEQPSGEVVTQRIAALVGYSGDYRAWGVEEKDQVLPAEDFFLLEVEGFVLVIETSREKEESRIVDEFLNAGFDSKGNDIAVYRFMGFASEGGLGTTRFEFQGSAESVVEEK